MTTTTQQHRPTTVHLLGGAGKTGRRVADRLVACGLTVRLASRSTDPAFDWTRPETHRAALAGADAAYLAYYPDISFPDAAEHVRHAAEAAVAEGLRRLVLLSGRGEPEAEPAENALRAAAGAHGCASTVVRCAFFMQNFSEHFLSEPVRDGVIALPAGAVTEPFVDLEDVADVVLAALLEPGHDGTTYDLTGPELLTFGDAAEQLSAAAGRTIRFLDVTPAEYAAGARVAGVPEEEITPLAELFSRVLDGHNSVLTGDVDEVLGRPATSFAAYCRRTARTGVWDVPSSATGA